MTDPHNPREPTKPYLKFDWTDFVHYLEQSDLSEEQKREFIETLWSIILAFVDLGFGISAQDRAAETRGQVFDLAGLLSASAAADAKLSAEFNETEKRQLLGDLPGTGGRRQA